MKNENKRKIEEQKQTPISDGDTRPDQQSEGTWPLSNEYKDQVTKERGADVNSLEDYKDGKSSGGRSNKRKDAKDTSAVPYQHDEENE
jgi:hypothetical protein